MSRSRLFYGDIIPSAYIPSIRLLSDQALWWYYINNDVLPQHPDEANRFFVENYHSFYLFKIENEVNRGLWGLALGTMSSVDLFGYTFIDYNALKILDSQQRDVIDFVNRWIPKHASSVCPRWILASTKE